MKEVILIAAVSKNLVIGNENTLLWKLPKDMKYFADVTKGNTVIMGRKTYDSIPAKYKPLPDRRNIVLSRWFTNIEGCEVYDELENAIEYSTGKVFIIGGGEIYKLALPLATKLMITEVNINIEGDTKFPDFDTTVFKETSRVSHPSDEKHKYSFEFVTYEKQ